HLQRAGRALRALHSGPASLAGTLDGRDFATEVEAVRRASEHICALLPRTGAVIAETLERASSIYHRLPPEAPTFTHRDFKADPPGCGERPARPGQRAAALLGELP